MNIHKSQDFYGFTDMDYDVRANSFLGKYHETKKGKAVWELSFAQKSEPVLRRTVHKDISFIIAFFFFPQTY